MRLASQLVPTWSRIGIYSRRSLATIASDRARTPQTVIEKVVQKYAVGLPDDKVVKAGDYVMIQPEHVMTHDNTGPVISKCVLLTQRLLQISLGRYTQIQIDWCYKDPKPKTDRVHPRSRRAEQI